MTQVLLRRRNANRGTGGRALPARASPPLPVPGQILPYIISGGMRGADAGNQAIWRIQTGDVLSRREPAARAHQRHRLRRQDSDFKRKPACRRGAREGVERSPWRDSAAPRRIDGAMGRIPEVIAMRDDMPKVTKLRPAGPRALRIRFAGDGRERKLDLTGLMARSTHFAPLMDDGDAFARARVVEGGLGVAWPIRTKWGRLDLSAETLRRIADEQEPMTGADFARWREGLGLSLTEAAKVLGG